MAISADDFRLMMRRYPAAVTVIATGQAPQRSGMTATAVMSLSVEPVRLVCAVNKASYTYSQLARNGTFCINMLANDQVHVAQLFSGRGPAFGDARFGEADWAVSPSGSPMLKGAVLNFDCVLAQSVDAGTHALIVGEVVSGVRSAAGQPLLYMDGSWAGIAAAEAA